MFPGLLQIASEGNWMHLHYQSKLQAKKALSKDGKIFNNCVMIGVKPCIDKVFYIIAKENGFFSDRKFMKTSTRF